MNSLMDSINGSKDLYKELSRVCHPDRFTNSDKQKNAEEIFQEISKNKRDFNKLSELKKRVIAELNINLK
jgi:curved DNA-binding protein CbpA